VATAGGGGAAVGRELEEANGPSVAVAVAVGAELNLGAEHAGWGGSKEGAGSGTGGVCGGERGGGSLGGDGIELSHGTGGCVVGGLPGASGRGGGSGGRAMGGAASEGDGSAGCALDGSGVRRCDGDSGAVSSGLLANGSSDDARLAEVSVVDSIRCPSTLRRKPACFSSILPAECSSHE